MHLSIYTLLASSMMSTMIMFALDLTVKVAVVIKALFFPDTIVRGQVEFMMILAQHCTAALV